jgi:hypothetical protein
MLNIKNFNSNHPNEIKLDTINEDEQKNEDDVEMKLLSNDKKEIDENRNKN